MLPKERKKKSLRSNDFRLLSINVGFLRPFVLTNISSVNRHVKAVKLLAD